MNCHSRLCGLAGLAFAFLVLQSCPPDHVAAAAADVAAGHHNLFLWRVTGSKGTVFLLGSVHFGSADLFPLPQEIEQAFRSADYLVEEIDPKQRDPVAARQFWLAHGRYTDGDRLENHISENTKTALSIYLELTGRPAMAFSLTKPWLVSLLINNQGLRRYGFSGKQGIDNHFADEAAASRKPTIGLETPDYQMNLLYWRFSNLSDEAQDKMLLWTILHAQNAARHLGALIQAWRNGDTVAVAALNADHSGNPQSQLYFDEIFRKRNLRMAQQIQVYLYTPNTYFIVVGAGHLVGSSSIVELLQEQGYRVDQLTSG
jgi:uncharacterized protein YbaP (TraB family)